MELLLSTQVKTAVEQITEHIPITNSSTLLQYVINKDVSIHIFECILLYTGRNILYYWLVATRFSKQKQAPSIYNSLLLDLCKARALQDNKSTLNSDRAKD